jgi:hypothetical protein
MINTLHQFIGNCIEHEGQSCCLIEILEAEQALVFICPGAAPIVQANQHGEAGRHAPQTWTVPMLSSIGNDLHPVAKQVFPVQIHNELLARLIQTKLL